MLPKAVWIPDHELPYPPRTLVYDVSSGRQGMLMGGLIEEGPGGREIHRLYLRPEHGGREWSTDPDSVKAAES
ncbi:hypothetical protein [Streptomyces carpaticus]|uniref:Uncharacterized protein n=1 Tax=Streptomyces carpaticus TaxID=285558 RepID=A0ABV4ZSH9_9ACTN